MKLFAIFITNTATAYGGAQSLRQVVLFVSLGNPIVYKGNAFVWQQDRKLVSGTLNGNSFAYNYDGNGMRYEKVVNGVRTCYYYNTAQANKMVLQQAFDGNFYRNTFITFLQSGVSVAINAAQYYLV